MTELLDAIPRIHPDAGVQRVGGRLLAAGPDAFLHLFEDDDGAVSPVAERIVELIDGQRRVREIVAALLGEFDVDAARCTQDTTQFIQRLADQRLLLLASRDEGRAS